MPLYFKGFNYIICKKMRINYVYYAELHLLSPLSLTFAAIIF